MSDATKSSEIPSYNFGDQQVDGLNPNDTGFETAPAGAYIFKVYDYEIEQDHDFNYKGETFTLHQIRPKMRITPGQPHAGGSAMAFLPMPTPGKAMIPFLANQWANFCKSLGFTIPEGSTDPVPTEMRTATIHNPLELIKGRTCAAIIENQIKDGELQVDNSGKPRTGVKLFGFRPTAELHTIQHAPTNATATQPKPAAKPVDTKSIASEL